MLNLFEASSPAGDHRFSADPGFRFGTRSAETLFCKKICAGGEKLICVGASRKCKSREARDVGRGGCGGSGDSLSPAHWQGFVPELAYSRVSRSQEEGEHFGSDRRKHLRALVHLPCRVSEVQELGVQYSSVLEFLEILSRDANCRRVLFSRREAEYNIQCRPFCQF